MTASSGAPEMIFRASKLGADDFLGKPIDFVALDQRMSRLLDGQRLTSEVTPTARPGSAAERLQHVVRHQSRRWRT